MTIDINSVNIQPSQKSEKVDRFLELLAAQIAPDKTHKPRVQTINDRQCMTCANPDLNFRDELSLKEYTISGMCMSCQDEFFGKEEPA